MEKEVYIIGGGPSLKGYPWEKLKDKTTIGINEAYKHNPTHLFWLDEKWYQSKEGLSHPQMHTVHPVHTEYPQGVNLWSREQLGMPRNSGYASIHLAAHLGYTRVFLLGFDFYHTQDTHWHSAYKTTAQKGLMRDHWLPQFRELKTLLPNIGIYNCNPQSKLREFPFCGC